MFWGCAFLFWRRAEEQATAKANAGILAAPE
jgi:hypothetical protein